MNEPRASVELKYGDCPTMGGGIWLGAMVNNGWPSVTVRSHDAGKFGEPGHMTVEQFKTFVKMVNKLNEDLDRTLNAGKVTVGIDEKLAAVDHMPSMEHLRGMLSGGTPDEVDEPEPPAEYDDGYGD